MTTYASSRRNGMAFEPIAGTYATSLGLTRVTSPDAASAQTRDLLDALSRYPDVSVGRNSLTEGVWMDDSGRPIILECSGSTADSRVPGMSRPDTSRKLLGAAAAVAYTCRITGAEPPGYLIITTALPARGTSAAGWVRGLIWAVELGDLASLSIHVLDRIGNLVVDLDATELAARYDRVAA